MLDTLFHEYGLYVTLELSFVILHGPFSWNNPIIDELPGCRKGQSSNLLSHSRTSQNENQLTPPFSHKVRGAESELFREAKNQNLDQQKRPGTAARRQHGCKRENWNADARVSMKRKAVRRLTKGFQCRSGRHSRKPGTPREWSRRHRCSQLRRGAFSKSGRSHRQQTRRRTVPPQRWQAEQKT